MSMFLHYDCTIGADGLTKGKIFVNIFLIINQSVRYYFKFTLLVKVEFYQFEQHKILANFNF